MHSARAVVLVLLLALGGLGCQSRPPRPGDVVVIVVVDTLRADRLGRYGNERGLTPVLDRLADRGVRFERAYAPCSWTMPSIASLFTSRLPSQHRVNDFDSMLAATEVTVAERLAAAGFTAAGFTANWRLSDDRGYAQGFARWRGFFDSPGSPKKARGEVLRAAALEWLDAPPPGGGGAGRRLLYLQYMEPHVPLEAPAGLRARFAAAVPADQAAELNRWAVRLDPGGRKLTEAEIAALAALYDAEVAAMDAELGRLLDALERRGILEHALIVVTADHGEEFLEHGNFGHGHNLFNTTVHVPLLVSGPGIPAGGVVSENVSLIDLAPTILDLLGLPPEPRFEGRSLAARLRGARPDPAAADIVLQLPRTESEIDQRAHTEGLVRGAQKLLVDQKGADVIFDLAADPGEQRPAGPPFGATLRAALDAAGSALAARRQPVEQKAEVDEATREKLRALGYQTH